MRENPLNFILRRLRTAPAGFCISGCKQITGALLPYHLLLERKIWSYALFTKVKKENVAGLARRSEICAG